MIDFKNMAFFKLKPVSNDTFISTVSPLLIDGEHLIGTYQSVRDALIFTNKRIISVNIKGVIGKKKDFTSLPYSKIQAYSVETAGVLDIDSEMELWFSGLGSVKLEFATKADITGISKCISEAIL